MLHKFTRIPVALSLLMFPIVSNGEGYRAQIGEGSDSIPLIVVTGTPYEMGKAFGELMREEIQTFMGGFLEKARSSGNERYTNEVLDAAWESVSPHTDIRFKDELKGISEGAQILYEDLVRGHMIPVVSDYSCSGIAVWGEASKSGNLFQIRNLDYNTRGGLQEFPAIVIYIPDEGIAHVNPTFAGVAGSNTGMNAEGIALTEIGDTPERDYPFNLDGEHFTTMFRDILYNTSSLDEAVDRIKSAKRIKKYHYVVGDGQEKKAVKMKAHAPNLEIWTDNDPNDALAPKTLENVVYHCEGRNPLGWAHLNEHLGLGGYGPEEMVSLSREVATKGGNLLNVVYDATDLEVWVAYAEKDENAYLRPYVHLKLSDYIPYNPKGEKVVRMVKK